MTQCHIVFNISKLCYYTKGIHSPILLFFFFHMSFYRQQALDVATIFQQFYILKFSCHFWTLEFWHTSTKFRNSVSLHKNYSSIYPKFCMQVFSAIKRLFAQTVLINFDFLTFMQLSGLKNLLCFHKILRFGVHCKKLWADSS